MKSISVAMLLCIVLLIAPLCIAQENTTPASLAKAKELVAVMGLEKILINTGDRQDVIDHAGMFTMMKIDEANPGQDTKVREVVSNVRRMTLPKVIPDYLEYIAELFATHFSAEEIDQITAFQQQMAAVQQDANATAPNQQQTDLMNSFVETEAGQKFKKEMPDIGQKMKLYTVDVMRIKERDLIYAQLREDLPKNGLKVPDPFEPDAFIDQKLHDAAAQTTQTQTDHQ